MQTARRAVGLLALAASARGAPADNPLGKVLDLLTDLTSKISKEGEAEAKLYKEFSAWCDNMSRNINFEITTSKSNKGKLEAKIGQLTGNVQVSDSKIEELASGIATGNNDLKSANLIREKEAADFASSEAELMEVIDTVGRAITVLEREMQKNPTAFAQTSKSANGLLQSLNTLVDAAGFSASDRTKLTALVQSHQTSDDDDMGAPAASAYDSHSGNILDVLEDLKEKAETQLGELRKAEVNARHNYEMLKQSLEDQAAADTKDMDDEKSSKSASQEGKASAEADLQRTIKDLQNSQEMLEGGSASCMQRADDHEASNKAREEELKALAEATQVLRDTSSGAVGQTYSLLQLNSGVHSRIQTRADLVGSEVVALVKRLARTHHSAALAQLASRISAVVRFGSSSGEDVFAKVKALIQTLIERLEQEASSEATEKAYCDEELAKSEAKKDELNDDVSKLTTKIDQAAARSADLKEQVKELQSELAALSSQQAEMDKMRHDTSANFVQAKKDLELGLQGVRQALSILRNYYASQDGASASMLQAGSNIGALMQQPTMPGQHDKATGAGASIIGILEVIESDFASALAKEETEEDDAQSEYEKTTQENSITRTMKDQDVTYQNKEIAGLAKSMSELSSDRENTDAELSAVLEYYSKLKERCIAKPQTYEERTKRREAEIAGLKDALRILEDETAFVQRKHHGRMRGSLAPH